MLKENAEDIDCITARGFNSIFDYKGDTVDSSQLKSAAPWWAAPRAGAPAATCFATGLTAAYIRPVCGGTLENMIRPSEYDLRESRDGGLTFRVQLFAVLAELLAELRAAHLVPVSGN